MPRELVDRLIRVAPQALDGLPVRWAYLFGSHADGRPRADSDIDVAVVLTDDALAQPVDRVASEAADALGAAAEVGGVEVIVLNHAPLRFIGRILRQRIVLYSCDEPARVAYESLLARMADDVEVWASRMDLEVLDAIAAGRR